eukprot:CAMPEP_0168410538 /NCGR_PEP_ID=MMETSP0228-20121227/27744_1 /TAXON_ID=133427 /ORGANISM="Protoceratium reticulatum, Strain CCCM 535 (=CCMP 1889)" /LENGTH=272 /DNA_ID=CAMNT_0008424271 /DNA_START=19 /DNA_END=832 /DNA_ORIENTATION=-
MFSIGGTPLFQGRVWRTRKAARPEAPGAGATEHGGAALLQPRPDRGEGVVTYVCAADGGVVVQLLEARPVAGDHRPRHQQRARQGHDRAAGAAGGKAVLAEGGARLKPGRELAGAPEFGPGAEVGLALAVVLEHDVDVGLEAQGPSQSETVAHNNLPVIEGVGLIPARRRRLAKKPQWGPHVPRAPVGTNLAAGPVVREGPDLSIGVELSRMFRAARLEALVGPAEVGHLRHQRASGDACDGDDPAHGKDADGAVGERTRQPARPRGLLEAP